MKKINAILVENRSFNYTRVKHGHRSDGRQRSGLVKNGVKCKNIPAAEVPHLQTNFKKMDKFFFISLLETAEKRHDSSDKTVISTTKFCQRSSQKIRENYNYLGLLEGPTMETYLGKKTNEHKQLSVE